MTAHYGNVRYKMQGDGRLSASARGYDKRWAKVRKMHLAREPLCRACMEMSRVTPGEHVDHIIPKTKGGDDSEENLQTLCTIHHNQKTGRERFGHG